MDFPNVILWLLFRPLAQNIREIIRMSAELNIPIIYKCECLHKHKYKHMSSTNTKYDDDDDNDSNYNNHTVFNWKLNAKAHTDSPINSNARKLNAWNT